MKRILFVLIIVSLPSCRSHKYCSDALRAVQDSSALFSVARSVDTIYRHDSVYVREVQRGDTVYLTRVEYRDRWRTQLVHDTVRDTQYITQTIEHPPERYVPKFYRWCTAILLALLIFFILRFFFAFKL